MIAGEATMQINIQGHGIELTPFLRDYTEKKINKLTEFFSNVQKAMVVLDYRKIDDLTRSHVAEVSLWAAGKKVIRATEAGQDMYAAIDLVYDELKRQLKKHKDKHIKGRRREAEKVKELSRSIAPLIITSNEPVVVKSKKFDITNMQPEEAKEEMKILSHSFFVFRNVNSGEINVLYEDKIYEPSMVNILSEEEAVNKIKGEDTQIVIFRNSDTREINVLYKRRSGNFGLIEPAI
jgi:putative sigma-54 modulation protein